jgi:hypothetical protein
MRATLTVIVVALVGLFGAASLGYAAYVVSRDQVGLPVTKLQTPAGKLAPIPAKTPAKRKRVVPPPPPPPPPTTTTRESGDDHGGRSRGGSGGGGHGSDD